MNCIRRLGKVGILICLLAACSPSITETSQVTQTVAVDTHEPAPLPLSEPGPYGVGMRKYSFTDAARNDREVTISVWYPAVLPASSTSRGFVLNADPDPREAPYPLILSSTKAAIIFAPYLVSHGFTWASVDKLETWPKMDATMIDQPLDLLFALNQVASNPPDGLEGMIDAEHAGATGYSFDGYNTLALSGARIDPEYYLAQCPTPDAKTASVLFVGSDFDCGPAGAWDEFASHAGKAITTSEDGLWQPMTEERIRVVIPLAAEGWWLFGERGLAAEDRPALMIAGSGDWLYPENALIFEYLGTPEKTMVTFIGRDHGMITFPDVDARMAHFMVAFFGYHLQGHEDYAEYFSEDFVAQYNDLAWGVYEK
jgi:predicted dienelactone hydrolase